MASLTPEAQEILQSSTILQTSWGLVSNPRDHTRSVEKTLVS
jgi:hypothetical protein